MSKSKKPIERATLDLEKRTVESLTNGNAFGDLTIGKEYLVNRVFGEHIEVEDDNKENRFFPVVNFSDPDVCSLHGYRKDCPQCSANFWKDECKRANEALYSILDAAREQVPDEDVLENIEKILKELDID